MNADDDVRKAELLRQFEAAISGAELEDLRRLAGDLSLLGAHARWDPLRPARPELRRPPLAEVSIFRVRVDLRHAKPPIWRRLDVRSDLTLDVVHKVVQAAFGWTDSHLWRFSLGGDPFDLTSQVFLCPWDVDEREWDDEGGVAASGVRLDETMQEAGDLLSYVYDYGDNWELALRLEKVLRATPDAPSAVAVDGRRAAPPEDSGGMVDSDSLAEVLDDPGRFDLAETDAALRTPFVVLAEHGFDRRLAGLVDRLAYSPVGEELTGHALALLPDPGGPDERELRSSFRAFTWFLDRAVDTDIPLTAAGYLKPADVEAAARALPTMAGWIGKANREIDTTPVLRFRKLLQSLGLLRKYKGSLRLTRAGARAQQAREELWNFLADKLAPKDDGFVTEATLLLLTYAANSADAEIPLDPIVAALKHLGWRTDDEPIAAPDLYWLPALEILRNVSDEQASWRDRWRISPAAARLARAALRP